jgi:WD40 repeat protein
MTFKDPLRVKADPKARSKKPELMGVCTDMDEAKVFSCATDGSVHAWNRVNGTIKLYNTTMSPLKVITASPFRRQLFATGGDAGTVYAFDANNAVQPEAKLKGHGAPITGLCFSPVHKMLLCSSALDKKIIVFDVEKKKHGFCVVVMEVGKWLPWKPVIR